MAELPGTSGLDIRRRYLDANGLIGSKEYRSGSETPELPIRIPIVGYEVTQAAVECKRRSVRPSFESAIDQQARRDKD